MVAAGEVIESADINNLVAQMAAAFPLGLGAWTAFTPTLTQSVTVTKTITVARYFKIGRMVDVEVALVVTGAGSATQPILIGLPVAAAFAGDLPAGVGMVVDSSVGGVYAGEALINSANAIYLMSTSVTTGAILGQAAPMAAALAAGDSVRYKIRYESAA